MKMLNAMAISAAATMLLVSTSYAGLATPSADQMMDVDRLNTTSLGGGEFLLSQNGNEWIAFCLEVNENIPTPGQYYVSSVVDYAEQGGLGGQDPVGGSQDPLSKASKWLMDAYEYRFGLLAEFGITEKNDLTSNKVQGAFWYFENETAGFLGGSQALALGVIGKFADVNDAFSSDADYKKWIKAVNLVDQSKTGTAGYYVQSMVVATPVPEPATMLLFGAGIAGLAGVARRRKATN